VGYTEENKAVIPPNWSLQDTAMLVVAAGITLKDRKLSQT
jgi:hypothetical protein